MVSFHSGGVIDGATSHGTAAAEIVHDVAPGADLVSGGSGSDGVKGGQGDDLLWGGPGRDSCSAGVTGECE